MEGTLFLGLGADFTLEHLVLEQRHLLVTIRSRAAFSCCPICSHPAERVHSHYRRTVRDLPCSGYAVTLQLVVRRLFCCNAACPRRIFTERLPELLLSHAQMTNRLREALHTLSFATSAQTASRLVPRLGMKSSPSTLLRCQKTCPLPLPASHPKIGIDDFAFRRGQTYGTIIVNLETHQIVDLLPDRSKETAKAWLSTHPEIEVISRDRASNYADAAREGAPQALQVADRFHLLKNIRGKIKDVLDRHRSCLPFVNQHTSPSAASSQERLPEESRVPEDEIHPQVQDGSSAQEHRFHQPNEDHTAHPTTTAEQRRKLNRDKRHALYEKVKDLRTLGLSHYAIADTLGISRPTVRRFLEAEQFPERVANAKAKQKSGIVLPYLSFLKERWQAGCHNGRQLFREAKAHGYAGSRAQLERVTTDWRKQLPSSCTARKQKSRPLVVPPPKRHQLSPQQASWLFVIDQAKLTVEQQEQVEQCAQASEELAGAYMLCQHFAVILRERKAEDLKQWLRCARASQIPELQGFAKSIQQDYPAVYAACSQSWSQGQVEGHVNRLKCIKRQLYGRAKFDLLRRRMLLAI
jgi:transposase